ncbi:MAG: baseplate J/gp47 family protein [Phycisphaerales bacterium]
MSRSQSDIETRVDGSVASLRRSFELAISRAVAGAAHGLHGHLVWASRQMFVDTAEDEFAVRLASIWGIEKTAAAKASGDVDITGTPSTVCPDGTLWALGDVVYEQDGDATISGGGSATITVEAQEGGADGNQSVGATLSLVNPVAGIDTDGTVSGAGLTGGVDEETTAALRERLLARMQSPPKGGGPGDYEAWALEVSGTTRAWQIANGDGAGTVVLYFVMDNKVGTIIPNGSEVTTVQDYLDTKAPVTADVNVYAPTAVAVDFEIALTPNIDTVKLAVRAELEDYILRNSEADGTTFPLSQLDEAISIATGETDHVMTIPASDPTFTVGQIAIMGDITWV